MRKIIDGWAIDDPFPGVELEKIGVFSSRALSLFARCGDSAIGAEGFFSISGAIEMLGGMEHHHANFLYERAGILAGESVSLDGMKHEAIAFLNRMGQFHHFLRGDFVKRTITDIGAVAPRTAKLMVFRNKHAAHRSLDMPRGEPLNARLNHQLGMMGATWTPRPGAQPITFRDGQVIDLSDHQRSLVRDYRMSFQITDHVSGQTEYFIPEDDCGMVMAETYGALESIIRHR
jgi:hypothetical protein